MITSIVTDDEVRKFFLDCSSETIIESLNGLHESLRLYSQTHGILPNRMFKSLDENNKDSNISHIFMPVVSKDLSGIKILVNNNNKNFQGAINLLEPETGKIVGCFEAKQITAIRTALVSCIGLYKQLSDSQCELFRFEDGTCQLTCFGTGLQAFWHIYVSIKLLLSGVVKNPLKLIEINILYHKNMMDLGCLESLCKSLGNDLKISFHQYRLDDTRLRDNGVVSGSDIIFGCLPTLEPNLFLNQLINKDNSKEQKHTYISLIGSYKPTMHECDKELIDKFKSSDTNARILVDSKEHTLLESGELIESKISPDELIEIGELDPVSDVILDLNEKSCKRTITLCKIVGLAVMDVALAKKFLSFKARDMANKE
ncbi:YGL159W [Saccharomyces arboricola H-6]|uniref:YGL159W n=1 Tax=Saccharomyces arboricola (strain H-6 / AS 2.3317 / CBS 10644) TaxID=1160507 RepID=J8PNV8_SACAR|nr:YGL159W [Saccharomyces arboricola H-6]